jgi:hypothetical protein
MPSGWKRRGKPGRKVCLGGVEWGMGLQARRAMTEQIEAWKRERDAGGRFRSGEGVPAAPPEGGSSPRQDAAGSSAAGCGVRPGDGLRRGEGGEPGRGSSNPGAATPRVVRGRR